MSRRKVNRTTSAQIGHRTFIETLRDKVNAIVGGPTLTAEERLLIEYNQRKERIHQHYNSYISVIGGLAAINLLTAATSGSWQMWFLYPAIGWGIGLTIHTLNHRSWLNENKKNIINAEQELGLEESFVTYQKQPTHSSIRIDAWQALLTRCQQATQNIKSALSEHNLEVRHIRLLDEGLDRVQQLAAGAKKIDLALKDHSVDTINEQLASLQDLIIDCQDESLRDAYNAKYALLESRKEQLYSLKATSDRLKIYAENFILAVENMKLKAADLGQENFSQNDILIRPVERLSEELDSLRKVEIELAALSRVTQV